MDANETKTVTVTAWVFRLGFAIHAATERQLREALPKTAKVQHLAGERFLVTLSVRHRLFTNLAGQVRKGDHTEGQPELVVSLVD